MFIFQAGSTLTTAAGSRVELVNGAQACNVFWQVGSSATLGANSFLKGSILAHTSITVGDGVAIAGRALAHGGAVTLSNNTVAVAQCGGSFENTAPAIDHFSATLTGRTQTVDAAVGPWSVTDATGSNTGYVVTVAATAPEVNGSTNAAGTGGSLTLTTTNAEKAPGNPATTGPVTGAPQILSTTAVSVATAAVNAGQGKWSFPSAGNLAIRIPGDVSAGAYESTLTFTTAPPAT